MCGKEADTFGLLSTIFSKSSTLSYRQNTIAGDGIQHIGWNQYKFLKRWRECFIPAENDTHHIERYDNKWQEAILNFNFNFFQLWPKVIPWRNMFPTLRNCPAVQIWFPLIRYFSILGARYEWGGGGGGVSQLGEQNKSPKVPNKDVRCDKRF